jgi:hypothetical protein
MYGLLLSFSKKLSKWRKFAQSGTYVMIFKYFRQKIRRKNWHFLSQNKAKICKMLIITLVFDKTLFFRRKSSKIVENSDHNIDPWSPCLALSLSRSVRHFLLLPIWTGSTKMSLSLLAEWKIRPRRDFRRRRRQKYKQIVSRYVDICIVRFNATKPVGVTLRCQHSDYQKQR